jgi:acetyl-CoA C-acetyltransferase
LPLLRWLAKDLGISPDLLNGACALGHPIGVTGDRLIVSLLHALGRQGLTRSVAALCIGSG